VAEKDYNLPLHTGRDTLLTALMRDYARQVHGSDRAFATVLEVSATTYSNWMTGETDPIRSRQIEEIATALGKTVEELKKLGSILVKEAVDDILEGSE
jgi:transcriptional regulator with XRE-family HTH domain